MLGPPHIREGTFVAPQEFIYFAKNVNIHKNEIVRFTTKK